MSATETTAAIVGGEPPASATDLGASGSVVRPTIYERHHFRTLAIAVGLAAALPLVVHGIYGMDVASTCGLYTILSLGFYYQFALSGHFSFATSGCYAIGAFVSIWGSNKVGFLFGIFMAIAVCAVFGALLKIALARSPLIQFGIATLSATALALIVLRNWESLSGGGAGKFGAKPVSIFGKEFRTATEQYYAIAAVAAIGALLLILFERSAAHRDVVFARDMGAVARTSGLRTGPIFVVAFAIGAGYMGAAGSLFAHTKGFAQIDDFTVAIALNVLLMVLIGGSNSVWGPALGAILLTIIPEWLRPIAKYKNLVNAGLILFVVLLLPGGLASIPTRIRTARAMQKAKQLA